MKRFVAICAACTFATAALAEDMHGQEMMKGKSSMKSEKSMAAGEGMAAAGWVPRKVTKKDDKAIDAFYKQYEETMMKGDMTTQATMVDFPVYMATDDAKGMVSAGTYNKEQYVKMMEASMKAMPKMSPEEMKKQAKSTKRSYDYLTDTMVMVNSECTMNMGKEKVTTKGSELLINKDGKWMVKSMVAGGWGDMMKSPTTASSM